MASSKNIDRLPVAWQKWNRADIQEKILHLEEERRLLYVAITRSMETLYLFAPKKYQSQFIKELDSTLINIKVIMEKDNKAQTHYEKLIV